MKITNIKEFRRAILRGAWRGLRSQGFETCLYKNACALRGPGKTACAIGWLIPNEKLKASRLRRGADVHEVVSKKALANPLLPYVKKDKYRVLSDLIKLQSAHDFARNPRDMQMRFRELAHEWKVELPED